MKYIKRSMENIFLNLNNQYPAMFLQLHKPPVFIDEVQYVSDIANNRMKRLSDTERVEFKYPE